MSSTRKMSTAIQYYKPNNTESEYDLVEVEADAQSKAGDGSSDDSSSEDEDGDEEGEKVSVKDMLTQVLKEIRNGELDLTDSKKLAAFATHRGPDLARQTGDKDQPTALHIMAKEDKKSLPNLDEKIEPLIKFLCKQKNYLEIKDRSGRTSLFLAIEQRKKIMVQWMCDSHPDISNIISIVGSKGMNCLHIGINKRIKFLDLLIERAKPEAFAAKDDNGNTPLHLAVDYDNCKREQLEYVKMMLEKGDRAIFSITNGDFNKAEEGLEEAMMGWLGAEGGRSIHLDVVKAGHHGSHFSTTEESFLHNLQYLVISAGRQYGHPSKQATRSNE